MKKFKTLTVKNFQCYQKKKIELDPYVTTIIGPNDKGKSALLRALKWACLNTPNGTYFIHHGKDFTDVTLDIGKIRIRRHRGKENLYYINDTPLKPFGVPDSVSKILRVSDLNFQNQLDTFFWFNLTPGQLGKKLNQIVDLSVIDKALSTAASKTKKSKTTVEICESRYLEAKKEANNLAEYPKVLASLCEVEKKIEAFNQTQKTYNSLTRLCKTIGNYQTTIDSLEIAILTGTPLAQSLMAYKTMADQYNQIKALVRNINKIQKELNIKIPKTEPLIKAKQNIQTLIKEITDLNRFTTNIKREEERICQIEKNLSNLGTEYKRIMGKTCPLCKKPITKIK